MKKPRDLEPRKAPSQERSRSTVDAILQATTYLLIDHGRDALTTNRIADRAGVNIATLYQYFPNKETIVAALWRRHVEETRKAALAVLTARRGTGLEATVRGVIESVIAAHRVEPVLHRILTDEASRLGLEPIEAPVDAALKQEEAAFIARSNTTFAEPELALWMVRTAVHGLVHQAIVERPRDLARPIFVDELTRLITPYLRGLARRGPRRMRR